VLVLLALYTITIGFAMRAVFAAKDRFGVLLAVGLVAMLAFHVVVNIGMTIGIMPITGIPLPFMSYGGSALMTDYIAVGSCSTSCCRKTSWCSAIRRCAAAETVS